MTVTLTPPASDVSAPHTKPLVETLSLLLGTENGYAILAFPAFGGRNYSVWVVHPDGTVVWRDMLPSSTEHALSIGKTHARHRQPAQV